MYQTEDRQTDTLIDGKSQTDGLDRRQTDTHRPDSLFACAMELCIWSVLRDTERGVVPVEARKWGGCDQCMLGTG